MKKRMISLLLSLTLIMSSFVCLSGITASAATTNQQNIVDRANYMYNTTWVCQKTVSAYAYNINYTFYQGNTYHIPYGQPISSGAYIGFGVSVDDFLNSTKNANSVFYTTKSRNSYSGYYSTYYASDCSAFVSWCWGVSQHSTRTIANCSSLVGSVNSTNVQKLQLGDAINKYDYHVVLVSGLSYDSSGNISQIEITEQTIPQIKRSYYTPSALVSKYSSYTGIYRYNGTVPASPDGGNSIAKQVKNFVFDAGYYADRYDDLRNAFGYDETKLYDHFINHGISEGRCASPYFDVAWYMNKNDQELRDYCGGDYTKAYNHFLDYVKNEGELTNHAKKLSEIFDTGYYYNKYKDLRDAGLNTEFKLLEHFYHNGTKEWRSGSAEFDPVCYALNNKDVYDEYIVNQNKNVYGIYFHYMRFGQFETEEKPKRTKKAEVANIGTNFYATITDKNSGKNLELVYNVESSEYPDKNSVQINTARESRSQIWKFERHSDGTYKIINYKYGKALDVYNNLRTKTNIGTWDDNGSGAQRWTLYMKDGYFVMKGGCTGFVADVGGKATADYSEVLCDSFNGGDNQLFSINMISSPIGDSFDAYIYHSISYKPITADESNNVAISTEKGDGREIWHFDRKTDGTYIISDKDGKCLSVRNAKDANEANVEVVDRDDTSNAQKWYVTGSDGSYKLKPVCALGRAMDIWCNATDDGTNVQIYDSVAGNQKAQSFQITKIGEDIGTDFYANLQGASSGKMVSTQVNNNVAIRSVTNCDDQLWKFERQADNSYEIINTASGKALDVSDASPEKRTNVQTHKRNDSNAQKWFIYKQGENYSLCSKASSCRLDIENNSSEEETNLLMFTPNGSNAQAFKINKVDNPNLAQNLGDDFCAYIKTKQDPALRIANASENAVLKSDLIRNTRYWNFKKQSDGSYRIFSVYDGKCLDVEGNLTANGTNVFVCAEHDDSALPEQSNQNWYIYEEDGAYVIKSKASGKVLDISGGKFEYGTNIQIWERDASVPNQSFTIDKPSASVSVKDGVATISWKDFYNGEEGSKNFTIKIYKDKYGSTAEAYKEITVDSSARSAEVEFEPGNYEFKVKTVVGDIAYRSEAVAFTVKSSYLLGDVDLDGVINIKDATKLQQLIVNDEILDDDMSYVCDVTKDGAVNINDATLIQMYCANRITEF